MIALDDEEAYRLFFQRHFDRLFGVMLRYIGRRPDAEDIVQSVFLKVWEKRKQLPQIAQPESWLFITARNEFVNRFRKLRTEQQYRDYLSDMFAEELDAPDHLLIIRQRDSLIRKALHGLPEKQQQAFLLSREEGLTYEKIAERMGVARTTVKEHISRAMKTLRDFMLSNEGEMLVFFCFSIFS
ncbi:RNA polymerase sigma factor [Pseudoflavitalea rhizosphaerae]|uniref:RNA polymerase sigma factor n=1 Tax=Pseudoflavitalea rhizosphaerae TaxID=1884793 RepID=UPI0013DF2027|nr:RNA polymerase sigma-70 factor [Pseudoflavitalea rhizosphaerae]